MTLNELRYIVALARERHFGRAAEACFVSQPTLSVAVKKLEDELGAVLFERHRGEVSPTAVGEQVIERAQQVLEQVEALKQTAAQGRDQLSAPLRFGAIYTIGPYVLPRLIPELHRRAPHMPLLIEEDYTAHLSERLKRGELDVVMLSLPFSEPGIVTAALYDEPFVVLLPSEHPWAGREQIRAEDLAGEDLLLLGSGHCFRDQVLELCPECARAARPGTMQRALEGSSLETIRHMVATGAGITVLPGTSARGDGGEGDIVTLRPFAPPAPTRRVALAWRRSFPRPEAVEVLRAAVRAAELPGVDYLDPGVQDTLEKPYS